MYVMRWWNGCRSWRGSGSSISDFSLAVFQSLPIQWTGGDSYGKFEEDARRRMAVRDEEDWLTVALALTLTERHNVAVWSQDKDFSVSSLDVLTTGDLLELLAGRE